MNDMMMQQGGGMPQMGAPAQAGPVTMELQRRFSQLSPQELQALDMYIARSDPGFITLIGKIFPELKPVIAMLQQNDMGGGGAGGMSPAANPLVSENVAGGFVGGSY